MNLVVCLKQVPDTETQIKIASDGKSIDRNDIKWIMNPYDEFAIEEALRIKTDKGGKVIVVSVGPKRVVEALRTALAMGADEAVFIEDDDFYGTDPLFVGKVLARVVEPLNPDIVFFGQRAVDDDCGLTAGVVAEFLKIPQLLVITKQEINENGKIVVTRPVEGQIDLLSAQIPVCLSAQKGLNEPRYASLPGIMKAKKKPLETKTLKDLGLEREDKIEIISLSHPPERESGVTIEGETSEEMTVNLVKVLRDNIKIL